MEVIGTDRQEEAFYSLSETARLLGVSERTMTRWIQAGKLPAYRPGKEYRIRRSDIEAFLEERREVPLAEREPSLFNGLKDAQRDALFRQAGQDLDALSAVWERRLAAGALDLEVLEAELNALDEFMQMAMNAEARALRDRFPDEEDVTPRAVVGPAVARYLQVFIDALADEAPPDNVVALQHSSAVVYRPAAGE